MKDKIIRLSLYWLIAVILTWLLLGTAPSEPEVEIVEEPTTQVVREVVIPLEINDVPPIMLPEDNVQDIEAKPTRIDCPLSDEMQQMILERCEELNLDFALTMAVIYTESSFRPNADSGSSVGLMQINRVNHKWLSKELGLTNFFDPEENVKAGTYMLWQLFEKYDDSAKVLMAYNMGEAGAKRLWNKGVYTTNYVEKVFARQELYYEQIKLSEVS